MPCVKLTDEARVQSGAVLCLGADEGCCPAQEAKRRAVVKRNPGLCCRSVQKRRMGGWVEWVDCVWEVIKAGD